MTAKKLSVIILVVLVIVFIISASVMFVIKDVSGVKIADRSIIVINLEHRYPERTQVEFALFGMTRKLHFYKMLRSIYAAAEDNNIEAIILKGYSTQRLSRSWELLRALKYFKERGKRIYGYFELAGASNLMLSAVCDTIAMPPQGVWVVPGFAANLLFLRGTFEKLGIGFDVIQFGKYKSAGEMLTNDSMSVWMRESYEKLLDDLFYRFVNDCSQGWRIPQDSIITMVNSALFDAYKAVDFGIVDTIVFWQDFKNHLVGDDDDRFVSLSKYARRKPPWKLADKKIALVIAEGSITVSKGKWSEGITAKRYAKTLRKLADDDDVDAIVFRVNSPGGSALASDIIHNEVVRASAKKPLIVSMGSVAASGGYYISMAADTIMATPYSITGSIGVIMLKPHFGEMYNKIGAHSQSLKRGKYADIFVGDHPMTEDERALLTESWANIYEQFVSKAAEGRDTSYEWIDSVAQGRIWAATSAESLALLDTLGSLWDAIAMAERIVGVPEGEHAKIVVKPRPASFFEVFQSFSEAKILSLLPQLLLSQMRMLEFAEQFSGKPLYLWTGEIKTN